MYARVLLTATHWWPHSAQLAIALAGAGCEVAALCPGRGHPLATLHSVQLFPYDPWDHCGSLARAIESARPSILIPCDDRAAYHLYDFYDRLGNATDRAIKALIERSLGPADAYPILKSRFAVLRLAAQEGIDVPYTVRLREAGDIDSWCASQPLPWVFKADGTSAGDGVRIIENLGQAHAAFRKLTQIPSRISALKRAVINRDHFALGDLRAHPESGVTAQTYVDGRPANIAVLAYRGKVLAAIAVEVVVARGATEGATVVRVVERIELLKCARAVVSRLFLSGFYGFDFMIEKGTARPWLIEVNPRVTPQCHIRLGARRDLPGALASVILGKPTRAKCVTRADIITYFPDACRNRDHRRIVGTVEADRVYSDVPLEEPDLIKEMLKAPWPCRGMRSRLFERTRALITGNKAENAVMFPTALSDGPIAAVCS